jgi:hypothetical protein
VPVTVLNAFADLKSPGRSLRVDIVVALALFVGVGLYSYFHWKRVVAHGQPFYYQLYFEPAVMIGCGKGFVVARPQVPEMVPFLLRQTDTFSCDHIRPDAPLTTEDMFQQGSWTYLMIAVGWTWRLFGVAWSALGPLFAVLFAGSIVSAYAVFRLGMNRVMALIGAAILTTSPLHLKYLTALRDYAKAPFMLALIFLLGLLVKQRAGWKPVLATAAAYGAVCGLGYGFRTDFLSFIPPFIFVAFAFLEGGVRRNLGLKAAAIAVCLAAFGVAAWPVFASLDRSRPGCQWHVVMMGLARTFDGPLGIEPAPYEVDREYLDEFAHTTATSYAGRRHPGIGRLDYCETGHGNAVREFLTDVVTRFPADLVIRAYASMLRVADLPWIGYQIADESVDEPNFNVGRHRGVAIVIAAVVAMTAIDLRLGLFLAFFLVYFGGLPGLQFDPRHFFHLEIVTWWCGAFLVSAVVGGLRRVAWKPDWAMVAQRALRPAALVAGCLVTLWAVLWASRAYQQPGARRLLSDYVNAPRDLVPLNDALGPDSAGHIRISPRTLPETADFITVDVNASRCGARTAVAFRYDDSRKPYSRVFAVPKDDTPGLTHIFMPIYDGFRRLEVEDAAAGCIDGVYRVREPARFTLLMETMLRPNWRREPLYKQLKSTS